MLTRHLRAGDWVLLDELNLAPQQTLEGLNPLLDHRRCIYLPTSDDPSSCSSSSGDASKKGTAVYAPPGFVLFATQNPHATAASASGGSCAEQRQCASNVDVFQLLVLPDAGDSSSNCSGSAAASRAAGRAPVSKAVGGRKGLPQSFLNRFCRIRVDEMLEADMVAIAHKLLRSLDHHQQHLLQERQQTGLLVVKRTAEQEAEADRGLLLLSACVVRCVRCMAHLAAKRPFRDLGDTAFNLRDATRVINLVARQASG